MNLEFATIRTRDLASALNFYQGALGLNIDRRFQAGPNEIVFLAAGRHPAGAGGRAGERGEAGGGQSVSGLCGGGSGQHPGRTGRGGNHPRFPAR